VERPPSKFRAGDAVEVVASDKNRTYHKGRVRQVTWHFKDREWNFFIEENGKKIGKRYLATDLRAVDSATGNI
jgi:hypothetical protein